MKRVLLASGLVLAGAYGVSAHAQEAGQPSFFEKPMAAPTSAFELNVSTAYNQGWGNLTDTTSIAGREFGRKVQDVGGAGIQFGLDLGYRISPMLAAGVYGTYAEYSNQTALDGTNNRSITAGLQGTWFMRPFRALNPWASLGSAYRGNWVVPEIGGITQRHGWEVARLQIGADLRASREISVSPVVGADINLLFSEKLPNQNARNLDGPPAYWTFTAGIMGRFDIGGKYVAPGGAVARK